MRAASLLVGFFIFGIFPIGSLSAWASGNPTHFIITIERFELKNTQGEWITVIEPDLEVDLVEKDASVSFFNTSGRVPTGDYVNFRVVLSETIRVMGKDKANKTKEGGEVIVGGKATRATQLPDRFTSFKQIVPTWNENDVGMIKVHLNLNDEDKDDQMSLTKSLNFSIPFSVKKGSFVYVWFSLDLTRTVYYAYPNMFETDIPPNHTMYCLLPNQIEEFMLTVDEHKEIIEGGDLTLWF